MMPAASTTEETLSVAADEPLLTLGAHSWCQNSACPASPLDSRSDLVSPLSRSMAGNPHLDVHLMSQLCQTKSQSAQLGSCLTLASTASLLACCRALLRSQLLPASSALPPAGCWRCNLIISAHLHCSHQKLLFTAQLVSVSWESSLNLPEQTHHCGQRTLVAPLAAAKRRHHQQKGVTSPTLDQQSFSKESQSTLQCWRIQAPTRELS